MTLSQKTIDIIKATAPLIAPHALTITKAFYPKMFAKHPEVMAFFNRANQRQKQPEALANAIVAFITNIETIQNLKRPIELMSSKHCALQVLPEHYEIVHDSLLETVGEILEDAVTPEIGAAWSDAVLFLSNILIIEEEKIYKKNERRLGGWRGWKDFYIQDIKEVGDGLKKFIFKSVDGYDGRFGFDAGQYLTLKLGSHITHDDGRPVAPRHYSVTSTSEGTTSGKLECVIKHIENGFVSTYMHQHMSVGSLLQLSPPVGTFFPTAIRREEQQSEDGYTTNTKSAVLLTAGIGITPMYSYHQFYKDDIALHAHVDSSVDNVPLKHLLDATSTVTSSSLNVSREVSGDDSTIETFNSKKKNKANKKDEEVMRYYETGGDHVKAGVTAQRIVDDCVEQIGKDYHFFYVSGPPSFMMDVREYLLHHIGVPERMIRFEAFGPQSNDLRRSAEECYSYSTSSTSKKGDHNGTITNTISDTNASSVSSMSGA